MSVHQVRLPDKTRMKYLLDDVAWLIRENERLREDVAGFHQHDEEHHQEEARLREAVARRKVDAVAISRSYYERLRRIEETARRLDGAMSRKQAGWMGVWADLKNALYDGTRESDRASDG